MRSLCLEDVWSLAVGFIRHDDANKRPSEVNSRVGAAFFFSSSKFFEVLRAALTLAAHNDPGGGGKRSMLMLH